MNIKLELKREIIANTISVKWKVRSDIGPEWIGSNREICLYKNSKPMEDNLIHSFLKEAIIGKVNIPDKSDDDTIEGDGDLFITGNDLNLKFRISYTIPYDYPHKYENEEIVLVSDIN